MTASYQEFLKSKAMIDPPTGITDFGELPAVMFPHQRDMTAWALRRGRAAIFANTGLGKALMSLAFGQKVAEHTGMPVIYFNPLAVSAQAVREAEKFGIPARQVTRASEVGPGINVTNYQKLDHFDMSAFGGVILGESSILKNHSGHYRTQLIESSKDIPFRLAETATPAPNDFMELGNHAEFLGVMSYTDMLATFFTHDGSSTQAWRLKGHAENVFWKWMASWSVMMRSPEDLGYDGNAYVLPPLKYHMHHVEIEPLRREGELFATMTVAKSLMERSQAKRDTIAERVAKAAEITPPDTQFLWWCHQNAESEALVRAIPGAVETRGSDTDEEKERKILDFINGKIRVLVTKPRVAGMGLNDSHEEMYQSVRRFWRFGQTKPVNCHIIAASTEGATVANIRRKEQDAERMAAAMILHTKDISSIAIRGSVRDRPDYNPTIPFQIPSFLKVA